MTQKIQISKFGKAFIGYGSYHQNIVNKVIHIICIPLIAATLFALAGYVPYRLEVEGFSFGLPQIFYVLAVSYYISLNAIFGILSGIFVLGLSFLWKRTFAAYSNEQTFYVILYIQIVAWILQFIGHGVFQKRKPALMDNISQILVAPLFVFIELCQLFGFATEELKVWKQQIHKNVQEYRRSKNKSN